MNCLCWSWIKYLSSPELVVQFQQFCGIQILPDNEKENNTDKHQSAPAASTSSSSNDQSVVSPLNKWVYWGNSSDATETLISQDDLVKYSMQNNVNYKISNYFLHIIFHIAAIFGNEEFLACFYAFMFLNVDVFILRRMIFMWMAMMYIGQTLKDVICWPRPRSPPVVKLERRYVLEYGLPSTHAMTAFALPYTLWILGMERHNWSCVALGVLFVTWCSLTSLSRLYLGMHSVLDVLLGLALALVLCPILLPLFHQLEECTMHSEYGHFAWTGVAFLLAYLYPRLSHFTSTRADTFATLACSFTVPIACRIGVALQLYSLEGAIAHPSWQEWLWHSVLRMLVCMPLAVAMQQLARCAVYRLMCRLFALDPRREWRYRNRERTSVELPYIFSQYIALIIAIALLCPFLFQLFSIHRGMLGEM